MPSEIETPQRPGSPRPRALKALENQLSSRAKRAAIVALIPVTAINSRKSSSGLSRDRIFRLPISKPPVMACMPIQRLDAATPRAARFPDWR